MNEYISDILGTLRMVSVIVIVAAIMAAGGYAGIWLVELFK